MAVNNPSSETNPSTRTNSDNTNNTNSQKRISDLNWMPLIALLLATFALGFAPILVRLCENVGPSTIAFWRMIFAIPFLTLGWFFLPKATSHILQPVNHRAYLLLGIAGISFAFDLIVWNYALGITTVANATLFVNFAPLFVALLSWIIFRRMLSVRILIGMMLAILGGMLLVLPNFNTEESTIIGDSLCILAAFFYGIYLLSVQEARAYFSTFAIMTLTSIITGITAFFAIFLFNESLFTNTVTNWQILFAIAFVVQVVGQTLIAYSLATLPATISSIILLLQPGISAIVAMFLFDEYLVILQWIGMFIVVVGIIVTKLR